MNFSELNLLLNIGSITVLLAGVVAYFKFKLSSNTIQLYQDNQAAQSVRLDSLGEELRLAIVDVAALQEEIRVIKTLPLATITASLASIIEAQNAILKTQNQILRYLESAPTASGNTINLAR